MEHALLAAAPALPLLAGAALCLTRGRAPRAAARLALAAAVLSAALVWTLILRGDESPLVLLRIGGRSWLCMRLDGPGRWFAGIAASLWPLTALYACAYPAQTPGQGRFPGISTLLCGLTLGLCTAGNLCTLCVFCGLLQLCAAGLIACGGTGERRRAARIYLLCSLGGALCVAAALLWLPGAAIDALFAPGGLLPAGAWGEAARCCFLLGFFGFGVQAAVFPLHGWLPGAGEAGTPAAALLEAVAVTNAGAFAVIRLSWCVFPPELLRGSWAQTAALCTVIFTLLFGAAMALKQGRWKRRLAWSTVSNLSFLLFGVLLLVPEGLQAGLLHMAAHAAAKLLALFCAGAVLQRSGVRSLSRLGGMGRRMPLSCAAYTLTGLSLMGTPPLLGFVGKWHLLCAAAAAASPVAYVGAGALLTASTLAAIYLLSTAVKAWFPARDTPLPAAEIREADWRMLVPIALLAAALLLFGLWASPLTGAAARIAGL